MEQYNVQHLTVLQLTATQMVDLQRVKDISCALPVDAAGTMATFNLWQLKTFWPQDCNCTTLYHLVPEAVFEEAGRAWTYICGSCSNALNKQQVPELAVANSIDLGSAQRLTDQTGKFHLSPLTLLERAMISQQRRYQVVIELQTNRNVHAVQESLELPSKQWGVHGHAILFDHDAPEVTASLFNKDFDGKHLHLQFVGPEAEADRLWRRTTAYTGATGRWWVLLQWMTVLKHTNPAYQALPLPDEPELKARLRKWQLRVLKPDPVAVSFVTNKSDITAAAAAGVDTAHVRSTHRNIPQEPLSVQCSYLGRHAAQGKTGIHLAVDAAYNKFYQDSRSARAPEPVNEFRDNSTTLATAFPDVFLLGPVYRNRPRFGIRELRHLLLQHTTEAATCIPLIFHLFNQCQRHSHIRGVNSLYSGTNLSLLPLQVLHQ